MTQLGAATEASAWESSLQVPWVTSCSCGLVRLISATVLHLFKVTQVLILCLDINEPAESVLALLSPTAAEPLSAPWRIQGSILFDWTLLTLAMDMEFVVKPGTWD